MSRTPVSTYRLQISAAFTLHDAARRLPYLHDLGVDWVYLSPVLEAEPGSDHGYDVVSHDRVDPARGGAAGLSAVSAEARRLGMGVLVDIVPNHVGVATPAANLWWWSLLTAGRGSPYATAFDVDWDAGGGRVRVPIVGDDDLRPGGGIANLRLVDGELRYHDHRLPLAPASTADGETDPDVLHGRQHYELVGWRTADDRHNYRRFFAVTTLAGIRVEDPRWFDASHREIGRWFTEGLVDGLRVDHPDGLRDPEGYLRDLAGLTGDAYVLVEKILEGEEQLPPTWPTAGTTGYDVLGLIDRVLVDPAGQPGLDALEGRLRGTGDGPPDWAALIHGTKRDVADHLLQAEVRRVVRDTGLSGGGPTEGAAGGPADDQPDARAGSTGDLLAGRMAPPTDAGPVGSTGPARTATPEPDQTVVDAVAELLACFPVYRSYLPEGVEHLADAVAAARRHEPGSDDALGRLTPLLSDPHHPAALRFQQTSGMVMAKGVEDCAFYRHSRLTSLNEVGGDPDHFATAPADFHGAMSRRQAEHPHAMTTTSTHDTKRGEDVRARITALAEVPDRFAAALDQLLTLVQVPDPGFGSLLWQAVVGAWRPGDPDLRARLHAYAEKAMREAGDRTTWTDPDTAYEAAVHAGVDAAFSDGLHGSQVREVLDDLLAAVVTAGWTNALAAKLLALTVPGVPDVYQGSELWEQSLVDPDNRRPVDFDRRAALLSSVLAPGADPTAPTASADDEGTAKLLVTARALRLRRDRPELFTGYSPLAAFGPAADHLLAFDRGGAVTVATRLPIGLAARGGWGDTRLALPGGRWRDVLTDRPASEIVGDLLDRLPVALLVQEEA